MISEGTLFQNLTRPLVRRGLEKLRGGSGALPEAFFEGAGASLENRLHRTGKAAFEWYHRAFLMTPGLPVLLTEEAARKLFFSRGIETELDRFLEIFPALARLWAGQSEGWLEFFTEFSEESFAFAKDDAITWIAADLSDFHEGGRTVMRVKIGGREWFYKPRSGHGEKSWFAVLEWLNAAGFSRPFQILQVISSGNASWMEAAAHSPCRSRQEVQSFYHRAGALLYLYHAMGGIDLHCDNLIAQGGQPVLIDCETLFHGEGDGESSLLRCGMLPVKHSPPRTGASALAGDAAGAQTVFLHGEAMRAGDFVEEIVAGFEEIHRILRADDETRRCLQRHIVAMKTGHWRKILRPTAEYHHFLERSLQASALRDEEVRREVLESLLPTGDQRKEEIAALRNGDIPIFRGPGGRLGAPLDEPTFQRSLSLIREALPPGRAG